MSKKRASRARPGPKRRKTRAGPKATGRPKKKGRRSLADPSDAPDTEIRLVQPFEATKRYVCPGCHRDIPAGLGHLVAVPASAPDLRRHWHRGCWENRKQKT